MTDIIEADYIIVGAGSAGCVLANRLTASGRHRVLLLEAGGEDRNTWIHIPLGYGKSFTNPAVNWLYTGEQEAASGNRRIAQPRGKVLGGSSSINGLVYIRGQREDYDHWRDLGNAGYWYRQAGRSPATGALKVEWDAIVAAPAAFRKSRREFRGVFFFMGNLLFGAAYIKAADAYVQAAAAISQIPAPVME